MTDKQGRFEIEIKRNDLIRINEPGFMEYQKRVKDGSDPLRINLYIVEDEKSMNQLLEVGNISQQDLEYGIVNLSRYNNVFAQFDDAYDAIKYAIPAATITSYNGVRGVVIRGRKSVNIPNPQALIVVNGQQVDDVDFLSPNTITSIKQLDSQSAALFGGRGFNGVIAIETR